MSDFEQGLNQLQLDLISLLVNFSCELGSIITRYDFLEARQMILSNFSYELDDLLEAWGFSALFEPTPTWPDLTFDQFSVARKLIINGGAIRPRFVCLCASMCLLAFSCRTKI